jgi:hypothetical protein
MNEEEAIALIDAHLDRIPLTDEQSDALTAWIKEDPKRADEAFYRIFLHSYLRVRLKAGILSKADVAVLDDPNFKVALEPQLIPWSTDRALNIPPRRSSHVLRNLLGVGLLVVLAGFGYWWSVAAVSPKKSPPAVLYAYEGFNYPATVLPPMDDKDFKWPTTGGLQGLAGGQGWSAPWQETNSKVAIIVDYREKGMHWEPKDMRKFGPLGYSDSLGNVLVSSGNQMRTATSPRSIDTRVFDANAFPVAMRDEEGLGRDGSIVWISFLAQSSLSTADNNRYSYVLIGSKEQAGLRIGKVGASPSGNWSAVALQTGAEVNLRTSIFPSGEMVLIVARIVFRPGPEDAMIWINPKLEQEPLASDATLHLPIPDFRFDSISINANHSTDFDEIRFGNSFKAVTPATLVTVPVNGATH